MNTIGRHIDYLLMSGDRVALPGLGVLTAHGRQAAFDAACGRWMPPVRTFSFDPECDSTGIVALVQSYRRADGISADEAERRVREGLDGMSATLKSQGAVLLGNAGKLSLSRSGALSFEPSGAAWLSPSLMWLPSVTAAEIIVKPEREADDTLADGFDWGLALRRAGRVAAILLVSLAFGWMVMNNFNRDAAETQATFAPVKPQPESLIAMPGQAESTLVLVVNRHEDASVPVEEPAEAANPAEEYFLIVASLNTDAEARKFMARYPGHKLGILNKDGRYRVYAATGQTFAQAAEAMKRADIAETFESAWVCRK